MVTREKFVERLKAKLDEWDAELDKLEARGDAAKARASQRHAERVEALKQKRAAAAQKIAEIQGATGDAWENLKEGAESMWDEFTNTLKETKDAFLEGLQDDDGNGS